MHQLKNQNKPEKSEIFVTVAVDRNCELGKSTLDRLGVECVVSKGSTQVAALNKAIDTVEKSGDSWEESRL